VADVVVAPRAASDADDVVLYLLQHSPAAADDFIDQLDAAFQRLSTFPMIGAPRDDIHPGIRILVMDRYLVVHRSRGDAVEVITIFDGRRDPKTLSAIIRDSDPSRE
jgi:plasmid stabilization system protein ParE